MNIRLSFPRPLPRTMILPDATLSARRLSCRTCALPLLMPPVRQGQEVLCPRCGERLIRVEREPYILPVAFALAAFAVLLTVTFGFYMGVTLPGVRENLTLPGMMRTLLYKDYGFMANVLFVFVFVTPLLFILLVLYVYGALIRKQARPLLLPAARLMFRLRLWLMVDIFSVSSLVALVKIGAIGQVAFGTAFFAQFVYSLLLARVVLGTPAHWVYDQISRLLPGRFVLPDENSEVTACRFCAVSQNSALGKCTLCGARLARNRSESLTLSAAFLLAAVIFYLPSNLLTMMVTENPMTSISSQILDGVVTLWQGKDYFVAAIIFIASVAVPLIKIVSMAVLLFSVRRRMLSSAKNLTRLYHFIELVGRWSMVDIFVMILLMAAFATPIARVTPGPAAFYFTLVVVLTMLSTAFFDPRLLWEKEDERNKQNAA